MQGDCIVLGGWKQAQAQADIRYSIQSLQYLRQRDLPSRLQSAKQIEQIVKAINEIPCNPDQPGARGTNALTKTEKLMMINMAPVSLVDLTIVSRIHNTASKYSRADVLDTPLHADRR